MFTCIHTSYHELTKASVAPEECRALLEESAEAAREAMEPAKKGRKPKAKAKPQEKTKPQPKKKSNAGKARASKAKAKAAPKRKVDKGKGKPGKKGADSKARTLNSLKASAYHKARKEKLLAGCTDEEAKAAGRAAGILDLWSHLR